MNVVIWCECASCPWCKHCLYAWWSGVRFTGCKRELSVLLGWFNFTTCGFFSRGLYSDYFWSQRYFSPGDKIKGHLPSSLCQSVKIYGALQLDPRSIIWNLGVMLMCHLTFSFLEMKKWTAITMMNVLSDRLHMVQYRLF